MTENPSPQNPQENNPWIPPAYTTNIELASGETIDGSGGLSGDEQCIILWTNAGTFHNILEAAAIFGDSTKTSRITIHYSRIESKTFEGFTELRDIQFKTNGSVQVILYK